jgi:hypothetical protein
VALVFARRVPNKILSDFERIEWKNWLCARFGRRKALAGLMRSVSGLFANMLNLWRYIFQS